MKLKKLSAVMLALLMLLSLAACGGSGSSTAASTPAATSTPAGGSEAEPEPVTLKWVGFGFEANGTAANLIERYKEVAPHVTIEYQELGALADQDGMQKLDTLVASGEVIDLVYLNNSEVMNRAVNGAALPLNDAIAANGDDFEGDYGKLGAEATSFGGDIYGVPRAGNTFKVFYNKTMADENNITVPDQMTMEEFKAVAEEFAKIDSLDYPSVVPASWVQIIYGAAQIAGWQMVEYDDAGNVVANFDDERFRDSMEFYANLALQDKLSPTLATISAESMNRRVMLAEQQTGMIVDGPFTLVFLQNYMFNDPGEGQIDFELGVSELPVLKEADKSAASYNEVAGSFYAPKTCSNVLEAYRFMRFICNENFDINGVYMPIYKDSDLETAVTTFTTYTDNEGNKHENIYPVDTCIKAVTVPNEAFGGVYPMDPELSGKYVPVLNVILTEEIALYMNGEVTLDQFIDTLQTRAEADIAALG